MSSLEDIDYEQFVHLHQHQLVSCNVPERYWPTLFEKLKNENYDAGEAFQMQMITMDGENERDGLPYEWRVIVTNEDGLTTDDPKHIYLIDHSWTYTCANARANLQELPGLLERMMSLMDIYELGRSKEELIEAVQGTMWKFNQTYSFGHFSFGSDDSMPIWYLMDEFGSRIQLSDDPTFRVVPFVFAVNGLAYSIMWPVVNVNEGDEVTRGFLQAADPDTCEAQKIPWLYQDLKHISFKQEEPDDSYFTSGKASIDTLPCQDVEHPSLPRDRNLKVFTEYTIVKNNLTDERFEIVDNPEEADVLWYTNHFKDFRCLSEKSPSVLINQFPFEDVLTLKDTLAIISRRAASPHVDDPMVSNPKWLPVTFNLRVELAKFVSYFQHREERGLDNTWILKPWNLSRALDSHVTNNLTQIVRLNESGPKVVCKYIENPVLFDREDIGTVKFDIRYIVLMTSVQPLQLYAYQVFWLRFANRPYSLDQFDEYEKHFTVMNYIEGGVKLKQVHYDDFIPMFEAQNPGFLWTDVENDIFVMFKEMFQAAVAVPPPKGIAPNPQSRAMYAVDLMLDWDTKPSGERCIQPKVCEVNFQPDCARVCLYHPFFYNDLFSVLFLNDAEDKHVVPL